MREREREGEGGRAGELSFCLFLQRVVRPLTPSRGILDLGLSLKIHFICRIPMANLPFHLILRCRLRYPLCPIIKVRIRKIARRRKLTCPGKRKPKWQLTASLWLSAPVYVDGRDGDFSLVDPRTINDVRASRKR